MTNDNKIFAGLAAFIVLGGAVAIANNNAPVVADDASLYMDNPVVEQAEAAANTSPQTIDIAAEWDANECDMWEARSDAQNPMCDVLKHYEGFEAAVNPAPVVAAAPAPKTYEYTAEEAKYQYSFFYNFGRNAGVGHHDTVYNTKRQLDNHGFPPVTGQFRSTVKKCYDNTGDAYCWDF